MILRELSKIPRTFDGGIRDDILQLPELLEFSRRWEGVKIEDRRLDSFHEPWKLERHWLNLLSFVLQKSDEGLVSHIPLMRILGRWKETRKSFLARFPINSLQLLRILPSPSFKFLNPGVEGGFRYAGEGGRGRREKNIRRRVISDERTKLWRSLYLHLPEFPEERDIHDEKSPEIRSSTASPSPVNSPEVRMWGWRTREATRRYLVESPELRKLWKTGMEEITGVLVPVIRVRV